MKRRSLLCLTPAALLQDEASAEPEKPAAQMTVSAEDIGKRVIVTGRLGVPMGKIVTVKGTFIDGNKTRFKSDEGRVLLSVSEAGGEKLAKPEHFTYTDRSGSFPQGPGPHPFLGSAHTLAAYETGEFDGIPDGYGKYRPVPAGVGFGFYTELVILAVEDVNRKQK